MIKEIKLFGLKTMAEVNDFLLKPNGFIEKLNAKFTITAAQSNVSIKLAKSKLDQYFTIDEQRVVRNDYTIQFKNQVLQLSKHSLLRAKAKVTIKTYMNGKIAVYLGKHKLEHRLLDNYQRPVAEVVKPECALPRTQVEKKTPWRKFTPKKSNRYSNQEQVRQNLDYIAKTYG
jgi:hypothetical protein